MTTLIRINAIFLLLLMTFGGNLARSQGGGNFTLYGDLKIDESKAEGMKPMSVTLILYTLGGYVVGRQTIPSGSRYRFTNLRAGEYDIGVEVETTEIARVRVNLGGVPGSDFRQDLEFEWKTTANAVRPKPATVSAADIYPRNAANQGLFNKAQQSMDEKKYSQSIKLFKQVVEGDPKDFQAWTELGTVYLISEDFIDAEKSYKRAVEIRPTFVLALLNLGRVHLMQKKYEEAVPTLTSVVELQPNSADANYYLGEAYLQVKKGSKAVGHLTEAARLGRADAHLRLATLYNAVGMKDKAANEYEEFLKKKPDHPDRKKLEQYITANKKPS
ncbi:MAG TPA: tetratricopeptide repeat protein [Pyrinomonadaceae bacterium]|nr:tetratricopeptide repeat protein [Pyrinomonadaceae bacterium]